MEKVPFTINGLEDLVNELNNLAKNLFDSETLFFMIVGEPKI